MTQLPLMSAATDIGLLVVATAAALIALVALIGNRSFQVRDELGRLLKHYEEARFQLFMWRMEQLTRPAPDRFFSVDPISVHQLKTSNTSAGRRRLLDESLGSDWDTDSAHMHDVHFFALRVHA